MKLLVVMNPLEAVHPGKDTTFLLIREALTRKFAPFFCENKDVFFENGEVKARVRAVAELSAQSDKTVVKWGASNTAALADFKVVLMRSDPPVDIEFLTTVQLLALAAEKTRVVNDPHTLLGWNEKLSTLKFFKEFCPETLITSDMQEIRRFVETVGGKAVIKPLHLAGGEGIYRLEKGDSNFSVIVESMTRWGKQTVAVQRFLPEVAKGDKRIIIVDGEVLGAVTRLAPAGDHRSNLHIGGRCEKATLTDGEKKMCERLKPTLKEAGLFFVGLDVIGGYLTEINATSPTCFQEINGLEGRKDRQTLEALFFDRLLKIL